MFFSCGRRAARSAPGAASGLVQMVHIRVLVRYRRRRRHAKRVAIVVTEPASARARFRRNRGVLMRRWGAGCANSASHRLVR